MIYLGEVECLCLGASKAFGRLRIADGSIRYFSEGNNVTDASFHELDLKGLLKYLQCDDDCRDRLKKELGQTLELSKWNRANLRIPFVSRRENSFNQLEACIHEGHLYHPCFKTRTGFSLKDHQVFGPEAQSSFQLNWLAIRKPLLHVNIPEKDTFWRRELGDSVYSILSERLFSEGANWNDYSLSPLHPWQYKTLFDKGIRQSIQKKDIINLGVAGDYYQASQSLRTLLNVSNESKANIKLPLDIVSTSSNRNLQEHFVCTAPTVSSWLSSIVENDEFLQQINRVVMLKEYAGMLYEPNKDIDPSKQQHTLFGKVGAIFRESINGKLESAEAAVPFSSLMLVETDGRPFIDNWVNKYGVISWVKALVKVVVVPVWHLLVRHGIAFESHAQNLILIHKGGMPIKIAMRDFHEETEYTNEFLSECLQAPDLESVDPYFETIPDDEGHRVSSIDSLRDMFTDTICIFNLSELSFLLEKYYGLNEECFWIAVSNVIHEYNKSEICSDERIKKVDVFAPRLQVESLLTKKLRNGGTLDYYFHEIPNALR